MGEASQGGRGDSGEQGIVSDSRNGIKGRGRRSQEAKMNLGKHGRKELRKEEIHGRILKRENTKEN